MRQRDYFLKSSRSGLMPGLLMAGLLLVGGTGFAQEKAAVVPDAQIEANVLKALADVPQLADQEISTTTVYGEVTLSGTVKDEASRDMAEKVAADAPGVKKVVDQLAIGTVGAADTSSVNRPAGNPPPRASSTGLTPVATNPAERRVRSGKRAARSDRKAATVVGEDGT